MAVETLMRSYLGSSVPYFALVGVVVTAYVTIKITSSFLYGLWTYFLSSLLGFSFDFKKVGSWAVVTGCTDGIGKAYAENLAKRGLNLVLISRTQSKLELLAKDIESRFKIQTKVIAADFTKVDIYDAIGRELSGLDIGTLVNNVATCYEHPEFFHQIENREKLIMDLINCNTVSVAMMTSLILPNMVAKNKGVIINISSDSGTTVHPLMVVYSATKAFVDFFSRCLQQEYKSSGLIIQVVSPSFVATKMSHVTTVSTFVPSPQTFARSALNTVGWQSRPAGYWAHALQDQLVFLTPEFVVWEILMGLRAEGLERKSSKAD